MSRRAALRVALFAACSASGSAAFTPRLARAAPPFADDKQVDAGVAHLRAGEVDAALVAFRDAERIAPKDPRPRYLRGQALVEKHDTAAAIAAYREALALDASLAQVRAELGALLLDDGKLEAGVAELHRAVDADPSLGAAWQNLAKAEGMLGHRDASLAAYERAAKLLPKDVDVRVDEALELRKAGRHDAAIAVAREAVALDGASEPAHLALGFALSSAKRPADAETELSVATRLAPEDAKAWWALGDAQLEAKKAEPASRSFARALECKPSPQAAAAIAIDLARAEEAAGSPAKAESTLAKAIEVSPRSLALRLAWARFLDGRHRCDESRKALAELPEANDDVVRERADLAAHGRCQTAAGHPAATK